jgi:imidazoleglycerol phosphate dehydratase HisB
MNKKPIIIERTTNETRVRVELGGGAEILSVQTPIPMFTHMLEQLGFYWGVGLVVAAEEPVSCGDGHHLVEDVAITLGQALDQWLAERKGIQRFGQRWLPMDDALALAVVDLGGRPWTALEFPPLTAELGGLLTENISHFWQSFAFTSRMTLHLKVTGENNHHMVEAMFKAIGMALREAMTPWEGGARSTKGVLV